MSGSTLLRAPRLSRQPTLPLRAAPPHNKPKLSYVGVRASELAMPCHSTTPTAARVHHAPCTSCLTAPHT